MDISLVSNALLTLGALVLALTIVYFGWALVRYVLFGSEDMERTRAKNQMLNATITVVAFMLLWWAFEYLYRLFS